MASLQVSITEPLFGNSVGASFTARGWVDPHEGVSLNGWLIKPNGVRVEGTVSTGPPNWVMDFTIPNPTANQNYTLFVRATRLCQASGLLHAITDSITIRQA